MFMPCTLLNHEFFSSSSSGTHPNGNTRVQGITSSADSGFGNLDNANRSTSYKNTVASATPSQTPNLGNDSTRGRGQGWGRGSTYGTGNQHIEATPVGGNVLSNYNQVRKQCVGDRMRLWVILHEWNVIFC
jgi:hypothetical protein